MQSTVYKIKNIVETFEQVNDGQESQHKAQKFEMTNIDRAPGSGISSDLIAHHQGMYRVAGNQNYIVTGSAKNNPAYFYIIEFGKGYNGNNEKDYWQTDSVMTHPGGIQVAEDILVIGYEQYSGATTRDDRSNIRFYDISNVNSIQELKHLEIERRGAGEIASAVGLTNREGQWILAVRAEDTLDFYHLDGDPKEQTNTFTTLASINLHENGLKKFQCVNLFLDQDAHLYLFGMPDGSSEKDECWLYQLHTASSDDGTGRITDIVSAEKKAYKHFKRNGDGPRFKWASCVYFEPDSDAIDSGEPVSGQFRVYSIAGHVVSDSIKCNEWNNTL